MTKLITFLLFILIVYGTKAKILTTTKHVEYNDIRQFCRNLTMPVKEIRKKYYNLDVIAKPFEDANECCKLGEAEAKRCMEGLALKDDLVMDLFGNVDNYKYASDMFDYYIKCSYHDNSTHPAKFRTPIRNCQGEYCTYVPFDEYQSCTKTSSKRRCSISYYYRSMAEAFKSFCIYRSTMEDNIDLEDLNDFRWQYYANLYKNISQQCQDNNFGTTIDRQIKFLNNRYRNTKWGTLDDSQVFIDEQIEYICTLNQSYPTTGDFITCMDINPLQTCFNIRSRKEIAAIVAKCCLEKFSSGKEACFWQNHLLNNFGTMSAQLIRHLMQSVLIPGDDKYYEWVCIIFKWTKEANGGVTDDFKMLQERGHFSGWLPRERREKISHPDISPEHYFWFLNPNYFDQAQYRELGLLACSFGEEAAYDAAVGFPDLNCDVFAKARYVDYDSDTIKLLNNKIVKFQHRFYQYLVAKDCCLRKAVDKFRWWSSDKKTCPKVFPKSIKYFKEKKHYWPNAFNMGRNN